MRRRASFTSTGATLVKISKARFSFLASSPSSDGIYGILAGFADPCRCIINKYIQDILVNADMLLVKVLLHFLHPKKGRFGRIKLHHHIGHIHHDLLFIDQVLPVSFRKCMDDKQDGLFEIMDIVIFFFEIIWNSGSMSSSESMESKMTLLCRKGRIHLSGLS